MNTLNSLFSRHVYWLLCGNRKVYATINGVHWKLLILEFKESWVQVLVLPFDL